MGKSTTVDKLLIANSTGRQCSDEGTIPDYRNGTLKCGDMTMWLVSERKNETGIETRREEGTESVSLRLKNLVFFRALEDPHKEINNSCETDMAIYKSTYQCELLSNESTKIRVLELDVPGFFGEDAAGYEMDVEERAKTVTRTDLSIMRKILHIKNANHLDFNRIVPDKGSLKRTSQNLKMEIGIMEKYFGRSIFNSMVVVATFPSDVYEAISEGTLLSFPEKSFKETRVHFQEAMRSVLGSDDVPEPPIIFISLHDTCEKVLHKVQEAKVPQDRLQLAFSRLVCSRCGIKTKFEGQGLEMGVSSHEEWCEVPLDETTCHPVIIPKYSNLVVSLTLLPSIIMWVGGRVLQLWMKCAFIAR